MFGIPGCAGEEIVHGLASQQANERSQLARPLVRAIGGVGPPLFVSVLVGMLLAQLTASYGLSDFHVRVFRTLEEARGQPTRR